MATAGWLPDLGLIVAALLLGLRHGIDWDHIAAITDVTASQQSPKQGVWYGTLYATGHALVVFVIGVAAIALGSRLPDWLDEVMGRVVGITLLLLGGYVAVSLVRYGTAFRLQSRWMLIAGLTRRVVGHLRRRPWRQDAEIKHSHPHVAVASFHHDGSDPAGGAEGPMHSHPHHHRDLPDSYGPGAVLGIGALHGVGAETPTQILIFLTAAGAAGPGNGILILVVFLVGLFTANTVITLTSALGFVSVGRHPRVYVVLGAVTAVVSLGLGSIYLAGADSVMPALLGG